MKIVSIENQPLCEIPFLNAGRGPGSFYEDRLPVHVAEVTGLPKTLEAIIATADLQGRERFAEAGGEPPRLLGETLPQHLCQEILPDLAIDPAACGVILAGDFYTVPALDERGGSGDVTNVWRAFGEAFRWTAGVAGNHDLFGTACRPSRRLAHNLYYLDDDRITLDGCRIAGLGGIIGNPRRPQRKSEDAYLQSLLSLLAGAVDILVLHDGPDTSSPGFRGSPRVRELLETQAPSLVIRGHAHWSTPLAELPGGTQVLNVDARVAILRRA